MGMFDVIRMRFVGRLALLKFSLPWGPVLREVTNILQNSMISNPYYSNEHVELSAKYGIDLMVSESPPEFYGRRRRRGR